MERLGGVLAGIERSARTPPLPEPERRREARAAIVLPVRVRDENGVEWEGTTVDVSAVGVRIQPSGEWPSGALVKIFMELPDGDGLFTIWGVRIRVEDATHAYDFLEATAPQRARLRGLVARFTRVEAARPDMRVRILQTIAHALGESLEVDAVLDTALDALTRVTGHEISSLHLVAPDATTLRLHGERGLSPQLRELNRVLTVGEGLIGRVASTGQTFYHANVTVAPDLLPAALTAVAAQGIGALVCVAIQNRGRILGALTLGRRTHQPFSEEEIDLVEAIANQIGLALENAKLYEESRRQREGIKQAERQLLEGERLSTLGKLAAGVAHEINNPLAAILGQAELLLTGATASPDVAERVRVIIRETSRAARLLRNMLQLARRPRPERRLCSLEEQMQVVLTLKAADLQRAVIEIVTEFSPIAPVRADEDQLRQVLLNLVQNAQHAMTDRDGPRTLTLRTLELNGRARIEVLDTGTGIPLDVLPRLFDAFFTTKGSDEGTGLGLWVSYGIIEQHDGTLRAENRPGGGAAFLLDLPFGRRSA